jgi:hypothetical protein
MRRSCTAAALAAIAVAVAGCGSSAKTKANLRDVRAVVTEFALAHDARACDLLTDNAVQDVYGGFTDPIPKARANCRARSRSFRGQAIKITQVNLVNDTTAKVGATSTDGKIGYTVTVRKNGTRWKIDQITQAKVKKF